MATTEVTIGNMALSNVGVNKRITSLDDRSAEATTINTFYEHSRQYVLRDGVWSFAKRYTNLALVSTDPTPGWKYAYRYPSDCLLARFIVDPTLGDTDRKPIEYEIAGDDAGQLILTNQLDPNLCYTANVENTQRFDQMFVAALAWHLSINVGPSLSKMKGVVDLTNKMYMMARSVGLASSYNEEKRSDQQHEAEWIDARNT